jgi:outer membrane protein TolC
MATDADVLALVAQVAVLRQREIDFQADASVARAELNRLMGSPIDRIRTQVHEPLLDADLPGCGWMQRSPRPTRAGPNPARRAAVKLAETEGKAARTALIPQVAAQAALI